MKPKSPDRKKVRELILKVLERGYLMSLATLDDGGVWVADVIYVFDEDLNIYWMSDPESRHSIAISKHGQVSASITVSGQGEGNEGIQVSGQAQKISGKHYELIVKHFMKRRKIVPPKNIDVLQGDYWYMLKPDLIELIYEPLFGFDKKQLKFPR